MSAALAKPKTVTSDVALSGAAAMLDITGALYLADADVLVVADLHLEKGSSFAERGQMLPPYDTHATLAALADAVARFAPRTVVALGDSFHDVRGPERLDRADRDAISRLQAGREWIWVTGNHDHTLPGHIGGTVTAEIEVAGLTLRHEPLVDGGAELAGHLHPVGKVAMRGRSVRRRCFVTDGTRCLLPAFGAYAGGLNVRDAAFAGLFARPPMAAALGRDRVHAIGWRSLAGD